MKKGQGRNELKNSLPDKNKVYYSPSGWMSCNVEGDDFGVEGCKEVI